MRPYSPLTVSGRWSKGGQGNSFQQIITSSLEPPQLNGPSISTWATLLTDVPSRQPAQHQVEVSFYFGVANGEEETMEGRLGQFYEFQGYQCCVIDNWWSQCPEAKGG